MPVCPECMSPTYLCVAVVQGQRETLVDDDDVLAPVAALSSPERVPLSCSQLLKTHPPSFL